MKINQFKYVQMDANCYRIDLDDSTVIIDPCVKMEIVLKNVTSSNIFVLLTHGHFDHFLEIQSYFNQQVSFLLSKDASKKLMDPLLNYSMYLPKPLSISLATETVRYINDHDCLFKGTANEIRMLSTPGHTSCGFSFLIQDNVFTGDTLFYHSIGRTDLASANSSVMIDSLRKLMKLPKNTIVHPGHGETTSIEHEMKFNPYILKGDTI